MLGDFGRRALNLGRLIGCFDNWPRVLGDHLGLLSGPYVTRLRSGPSFEVRAGTDDHHVLFEVFALDVYAAPIGRGKTVVDIGANIGAFTVLAAERGARVLSFEPFPANFALLERNVSRNGLSATLVQRAVSDADGTAELYLPDRNEYSGRYSLYPGRGERTVNVECIRLDKVMGEYGLARINLLKIDCQGSEYEILYGASQVTLSRIDSIVAECEVFAGDARRSIGALCEYLAGHGFSARADGNVLRAGRPGVL